MNPDEPLGTRERRLWRIWWAIVLTWVIGSFVLFALLVFVWKPQTVARRGTRFYTAPPPAAAYTPARPAWKQGPSWSTPVPGPGIVWVNTRSHIYHFPGYRWYGTTIQGEYESERDAVAKGNRAALNERRPANFGAQVKP